MVTSYEKYTSYEKFSALFRYDQETGHLYWKIPGQGRQLKRPVGTTDKEGYRTVCVDYQDYRVHRIIWLLVHKEWPKDIIDHENRTPSDNRDSNLRDVNKSVNAINAKVRVDSRLGIKGLTREESGKIRVRKLRKNLGLFKTIEEAIEAYNSAE